MSDSDISIEQVVIKYKEGGQDMFMKKATDGSIVGAPGIKDALIFKPKEAVNFIALLAQRKFPYKCYAFPVK